MSADLELLRLAEEAARRAGEVLKDRFLRERTIEQKGEGRINLVTDADKASEEVLLAFLRDRAPGHAVLAEESGWTEGPSGYRWYVDPLDGTTNYAHRVPHFCVTLAVADAAGVLRAGVVLDPLRGECFTAAAGQGAHLSGERLVASAAPDLERALLCTGFPYDVQQRPEAPLGLFNRLIKRAQGVRRMGSAALDLAYVAAGRFDGFFEFGLKPWDTAAGALLVTEAGGTMTRIDGAPYDPLHGDVLASCSPLFPELASQCRAFLTDIAWVPKPYVLPSP